jgi:hypothetical protein
MNPGVLDQYLTFTIVIKRRVLFLISCGTLTAVEDSTTPSRSLC